MMENKYLKCQKEDINEFLSKIIKNKKNNQNSDNNNNNIEKNKINNNENSAKTITLEEMPINSPILLDDKNAPFDGVEYNFRQTDNENKKEKVEFWLSKFKPLNSKQLIKREFKIDVLGFENAKFLAMKYKLLIMMENK